MIRKILIGMACLGGIGLFLACQSDNGATGPVTGQDDAPPGVFGTCYEGGEPAEGHTVTVYCDDCAGLELGSGEVNYLGNWSVTFTPEVADFHDGHMMRAEDPDSNPEQGTNFIFYSPRTGPIDIP
jgi:hypothetical protein